MKVWRRALRHCRTIPEWGVRSITVLIMASSCMLLETTLWPEPDMAAPPGSTGGVSLPTPTPMLAAATAQHPTPAPLFADRVPTEVVPAEVAEAVSQGPEGFPPLSTYAEGLRPGFESMLTDLSHLTRYDMSVQLFPERRVLEGRAVIALRNNSADAWSSIVFRLPANHPRMHTDMHLDSVRVDGEPVQYVLSPSATVAALSLATPLDAGRWVRVELAWHLHYAQLSNEDVHVRNGANQDMINLPHFYPELAVHAPGAPGTNAEGWWIQAIPSYTDIRFHDTVLMTVTATAPAELVLVGSGTPVHEETVAPGRTRRQWVTGPVRGFVLQASPLYRIASMDVGGVRIQSFYHAEDETVALWALDQAAQALAFFSEAWMPYPYTHLTLVSSPLRETAMEYSNLIQIGIARYRDHPFDTAFAVTHEVAHQWMYLQVHNDPIHHPGLDEGLAELSYIYMMEAIDQEFSGSQFIAYWRHLHEGFGDEFAGDEPWWLDQPHHNFDHYHATHYRRPAVLLGEIWQDIGNEAFTDGLRRYMSQYRFGVAAPAHLIEAFRDSVPEERLAELEESLRTSAVPAR